MKTLDDTEFHVFTSKSGYNFTKFATCRFEPAMNIARATKPGEVVRVVDASTNEPVIVVDLLEYNEPHPKSTYLGWGNKKVSGVP